MLKGFGQLLKKSRRCCDPRRKCDFDGVQFGAFQEGDMWVVMVDCVQLKRTEHPAAAM